MNSTEDIYRLRAELDKRRSERKEKEDSTVADSRQAEIDAEVERLKNELAEEDRIQQLLAAAGQVTDEPVGRSKEDIIFDAQVAQAVAVGIPQDEIDKVRAEREQSSSDTVEPKVETPPVATPVNTGLTGEKEEK